MQNIKEVKDECSKCGEIFTCELCRNGHGIKIERNHVVEMLKCQFEHKERRENGENS